MSLLGALTLGACGGSALNENQQQNPGESTGGSAGAGGMTLARGGDIGEEPLPDPQCPAHAPAADAACSTPPSLTCTWRYSDCGYSTGYCDAGKWRDTTPTDSCWTAPPEPMTGSGGNVAIGGGPAVGGGTMVAPSSPMCPATAPIDRSACSPSNAGGLCIYDAAHPCKTKLATCAGGIWSIGYYAIDCAGGAGGASGASGSGGETAVGFAGAGGTDEG